MLSRKMSSCSRVRMCEKHCRRKRYLGESPSSSVEFCELVKVGAVYSPLTLVAQSDFQCRNFPLEV